MANNFVREPIDGADTGVWADFELGQNRNTIRNITSKLILDVGVLKVKTGKISIDNGTVKGVCIIDTETTISTAGVSVSNWAKVEISVSGTGVVFETSDISGATDPGNLPSTFTNSWDGDKQGYYITASKRTIGLVWKNAGGVLEGLVNLFPFRESFIGSNLSDDANDDEFTFYQLIDSIPWPEIKIQTKSADFTIPTGINRKLYGLTTSTGAKVATLPAAASNKNLVLGLIKDDVGPAPAILRGAGSDKVNGLSDIFLWSKNDVVWCICDGTGWRILNNFKPYYRSGEIPRSSWSNVHLGFITIDYNNPVGSVQIGDKGTGATNSSTGFVIYDDAVSQLVLVEVVNGGGSIFNHTETINFDRSGASVDVNNAAGLKNFDVNMRHSWNTDIVNMRCRADIIKTSGSDYRRHIYQDNADANSALQLMYVDSNQVKLQTGAGAFRVISDAGGAESPVDWLYQLYLQLERWSS